MISMMVVYDEDGGFTKVFQHSEKNSVQRRRADQWTFSMFIFYSFFLTGTQLRIDYQDLFSHDPKAAQSRCPPRTPPAGEDAG